LVLDPRVFGLIQSSKLQAKDALLQYVQTVERALREVDDAMAQLNGQRQNLQAQQQQARILARNVSELKALHEAELTSALRVLEAEIESILAQMVVSQAQTQVTLAYASLQQAMGIGALYGIEDLSLDNGLISQHTHAKVLE